MAEREFGLYWSVGWFGWDISVKVFMIFHFTLMIINDIELPFTFSIVK